MGWGPHGVPADTTLLVHPKAGLGRVEPLPSRGLPGVPGPAVGCQRSPVAQLRHLPALVTPRWLIFLVVLRREPALRAHIDIKKGPSVPIN